MFVEVLIVNDNDTLKEPLSFSTDDLYVQCMTDISKTMKISVSDDNSTLDVNFNVPIKDIVKFIVDEGAVQFDRNADVANVVNRKISAFNRIVEDKRSGQIVIDFITGKCKRV